MLVSLLVSVAALAAGATAAPAPAVAERYAGYYTDPTWPWYRVSCFQTARCPWRGNDGAAYTFQSNSTLTTACTQLPAGMQSCRLERFPVPNGVPAANSCKLQLYWTHQNGQCANPVMDMAPLVWEWSWNCGSVWGWSIQGYSVDCTQPIPSGGGLNRFAGSTIEGENAEASYGAGGDY